MFSTLELTSDGDVGDGVDGVVGEFERDALGRHQRDVLLDQRGLGVGEDAPQVVAGQRVELDADRQPALQFGQAGPRASRHGTRPRR